MSNDATQIWLRKAAIARPSAMRIRLVTDTDIVTRYVPRLAGRNVHLSEDAVWYDTRAEAVEAARRVRNRIAAEAEMSADTTQHTPADVREPTDAQINVWSIIRSALSRAWALSRPWAVANRPQVTSEVVARLDAIAADCEREVLTALRDGAQGDAEALAAADMERVPTTKEER